MTSLSFPNYEQWFAEFARLAKEDELDWLVPSDPAARRAAFDQGLSPQEELTSLKDMAEWRGCGCGGG